MHDPVKHLSDLGVSVWIDDLSRGAIVDGTLESRIRDQHVVGVTTNPTIFAGALAADERYERQLRSLAAQGVDVDEAVLRITTDDVRDACDLLRPVYEQTGGVDGRVSIEVDPRLAHDTRATVEAARRLWHTVDRPNLLVKIPATAAGLPAITTALAEGISVNVTLVFALERYRAVMNAFLCGLEDARSAGRDLGAIHSVASFFVSRVDTEVDRRLEDLGTPEALVLRGQAALANARLAFQAYEQTFSTARWQVLSEAGARPQRPLWASTGVKDPAYPDTLYVTELVVSGTVNTMPSATLDAVADHGAFTGDTVHGRYEQAATVLDDLERLGVSYAEVTEVLERDGVAKFEKSWRALVQSVSERLAEFGTAPTPPSAAHEEESQ